MIVQRFALLAAGPLAALGFSAGVAHADETTLFSGDGITILSQGLTGTPVEVGGLAPIDAEYLYGDQTVFINGDSFPGADVYLNSDMFGGSDTLVDLTPGQPIADSDILDTFSYLNGAVALEHADIVTSIDGLAVGNYDALVIDGTTFALPQSLVNFLGPDFGLTALDVTVLEQAAGAASALDLTSLLSDFTSGLDATPLIDTLTSLF